MKNVAIFGASSFAREVADICYDAGYKKVVFVDDCIDHQNVSGSEVLSTDYVVDLQTQGYVFAIGIGSPDIRRKVVAEFPDLPYANLIHPTVSFGRHQRVALTRSKGNIFAAGVRLTNNIQFGNFVVLNINVVVGHDCILEDFASVMSGSLISGNVAVREGAYIGSGACITNGSGDKKREIGKNSIVGAGSVVIRRVKENTTVFGNPARYQE